MEKYTVKIMDIITRRPILMHSSFCVLKFLLPIRRPNVAEVARGSGLVVHGQSRSLLYQTSGLCFLS